MEIITINLPEPYLDAIQVLNDQDVYPSRSEAIRTALQDFLGGELKMYQELTIDGVLCPSSNKSGSKARREEAQEEAREERIEYKKQSTTCEGKRHYLYYYEILNPLKDGPKTSTQLSELLDFPRCTVRADLKRLKKKGTVRRFREGGKTYWERAEEKQ